MAFTNFAVPLLEGKTNAWKAACAEINGAKKELYLASRCNLGITKEIAALQQTPMETTWWAILRQPTPTGYWARCWRLLMSFPNGSKKRCSGTATVSMVPARCRPRPKYS